MDSLRTRFNVRIRFRNRRGPWDASPWPHPQGSGIYAAGLAPTLTANKSPGGMPACFRRCPRVQASTGHVPGFDQPGPMLPSPPCPGKQCSTQQRLLLDELTLRPASIPCRSPCGSPALDGLGITDSIREDHTAPGQGNAAGTAASCRALIVNTKVSRASNRILGSPSALLDC